ncbi:MAG: 1-(5-phosphoribosyl)-5-[(5-phosphoribosylamino)methylideneamino]imidazole-4-carboxamide isomerase [Bacteroidales bacterium]|nr:1-(5-phosphoribosyl)-5-[(5-phosphoribosylamino)methylideneamino]imidazole-4-carboxamide isomerase [Bacteroidales bacterium]
MMTLIPAIDLMSGRCVRLTKGDYAAKTEYDTSPVDMAKAYADCGITRLHLVDLDGAKARRPMNLAVLEQICTATTLDVEWGGGVKSTDSLRNVLEAGARYVICGSIAVDDESLCMEWLSVYGADRIILGADVRNGMISTHGWQKDSSVELPTLIEKYMQRGLRQVICTDISRDGMLQGPNIGLYQSILQRFPGIELTLSGGVSSMHDLQVAAQAGVHHAIVGKAIYERRITLEDLRVWSQNE